MHVELYKIFVFWKMRYLSASIRSMHVELYKVFVCVWNNALSFGVLEEASV